MLCVIYYFPRPYPRSLHPLFSYTFYSSFATSLLAPDTQAWRSATLCFSADGNYEVTLMTKATVYHNGLVVWQPPAVYKSSCAIDVEYFPYDVQTCVLKLGSWTYDGFKVTRKKKKAKIKIKLQKTNPQDPKPQLRGENKWDKKLPLYIIVQVCSQLGRMPRL